MPAPSPEKAAAIAAGELTYLTGKPCKRGHISHRFVSGGQCVACNNEHTNKGREANPGRHAAYHRAARKRDPSKNREAVKRYRRKKPVETRERTQRWRAKNKERFLALMRANNAKRRAIKLANGGSYTADEITALLAKQRHKCVGCGCKLGAYQIDHIQPLTKGGSNAISNVQILCPDCNRRKYNFDPIEWARTNGRLL